MTGKANPFAKLMAEAMVKKAEPTPAPAPTPPAPEPIKHKGELLKQSVAANPFTTLAAAPPPATEPGEVRSEVDSKYELARIDTEELEPKVERGAPNINVMAANRAQGIILKDAGDVRKLCDAIDTLIESNDKLAGPPLIELREYVKRLMVTLKERPEFDSVVIDKDIRNVMRFIRATREDALVLREVKTTKKAARSAKKETNAIQNKGMAEAFAAIMGSRGLKI